MDVGSFLAGVLLVAFLGFLYTKVKAAKDRKNSGGSGGGSGGGGGGGSQPPKQQH